MNLKKLRVFKPLSSIKMRPYAFLTWFFFAIILGLAGYWTMLILSLSKDTPPGMASAFVYSGGLAMFGIVVMSDAIANGILNYRSEDITEFDIRKLATAVAVVLLIAEVILLASEVGSVGESYSLWIHHLLWILVIAVAVYFYCIRMSHEKSVSDATSAEEAEVSNMSRQAVKLTHDGTGVKL